MTTKHWKQQKRARSTRAKAEKVVGILKRDDKTFNEMLDSLPSLTRASIYVAVRHSLREGDIVIVKDGKYHRV
jgi:uncharacterized protein (DUF433 family)